jgi:hypothetical protein
VAAGLPFGRARAQSSAQIYFGGHAFLSKFSDIKTEFPYLGELLNGDGAIQFDRALVAAGRRGADRRKLNINFDGLATLGAGREALVMALAFDGELVRQVQIGKTWSQVLEVSFQVLVFDFSTKVVRASFPWVTQFNDASSIERSGDELKSRFARLVSGDQAKSVIGRFWEMVAAVSLPEPGARSLRVTKVALADAAAATTRQLGLTNTDPLHDRLGHEFGASLCGNQKISVLPYASSQAVDGKMAARLSNGVVYDLRIPKSDYEISLVLDGLKKVQFSSSPAGVAWVYGAFLTVRVIEPLSNRSYFDDQIKLGANRTVPVTEGETADWPSFDEVIRQLFDEFTRALSGPDTTWAKGHVAKNPTSLKSLKDLVDSCR